MISLNKKKDSNILLKDDIWPLCDQLLNDI